MRYKVCLWNLYCASVIILWISANLRLFKRQAANDVSTFKSICYFNVFRVLVLLEWRVLAACSEIILAAFPQVLSGA